MKKKAKGLMLPYLLWLGIYFFSTPGLKYIISRVMPQVFSNTGNTFTAWTVQDWIFKFLGVELQDGFVWKFPGLAPHFWFVRDLIILVLLSPIFVYAVKRIPACFFLLLMFVFFLPKRIEALQFSIIPYVMGLYWGVYDVDIFKTVDRIKWPEIIGVFLISFFIKHLFSAYTYMIMELSAAVIFLKLSGIIVSHEKLFSWASYLAGFSFFLYAIHMPELVYIVQRAWLTFFPMKNAFFCLFEYFGVSFLIVVIGTGIGIALKKICPPVFRLLNGGR